MQFDRNNILNSQISAIDSNEVYKIFKNRDYNKTDYICISNTHSVVSGIVDQKLKKATNINYISFADIRPLSIVSRNANLIIGMS